MTDRPSEADAPRPDEVRRSLRALAEGSTRNCDPKDGAAGADIQPASVVADAERAADCAREAVPFLSAGQLSELDRAVATAVRHGDDDVASRGRAARESLRRLDAALCRNETADPSDDADANCPIGADDSRRDVGVATDTVVGPRARDDHFHSGRGTVLGDTAQGSGR